MPSNRRVNQPGPARRRPKIAGTGRSIAPRPQAGPEDPAAEPQVVSPAVDTQPAESPQVEALQSESPEVEALQSESPQVEALQPAAAVESPQGEAEQVEPGAKAEPQSRRPNNPLQLAVALFVVLLVLIGIAAVVAKVAFDATISNQAYVDNAATDEVKAAAENALTTITAYKFDDMDGWADRSREVLTEDMRADFDKTVDVTKSAAQQSKTSTEAKVEPTGVTLLDGDQAEVLAFLTVSVTNDGVAQGSSSGPEVARMSKVDGTWVLSEIVLQ
jgi:Mce-associated membrane protein